MGKCPYSDIFGAPGTGVHRWRIPILDIVDDPLGFWNFQNI